MPAKRGYDRGMTVTGPVRTKFKPEGQAREFEDTIFRWNSRLRMDEFEDFAKEVQYIEIMVPLVNTASNADIVQTGTTNGVSRAYIDVPRAGTITDISFAGEDGITQSGTNYLTFTGLNKAAAGAASIVLLDTTAHVNTTDINASALNGGSNLTAKQPYSLALTATAAALYVAEGDVLEITATATAAGAVVDAAWIKVRIATLQSALKPTVVRTATIPQAAVLANTANGIFKGLLIVTSEAQSVRLDLGDQLLLPATMSPEFSCRLKIGAAMANSTDRVVFGLASAYTATLDSVTYNAWFRIDGSNSTTTLDLRVETDDNTTDRDDQATAVTLTADTYYTFTVTSPKPGLFDFWVNDDRVAQLTAKDFAVTNLLQPFIILQKSSGTGVPTMSIDWVRWGCARF